VVAQVDFRLWVVVDQVGYVERCSAKLSLRDSEDWIIGKTAGFKRIFCDAVIISFENFVFHAPYHLIIEFI